jgi:glycosyltransferase involved in cell wall biosynthesis
MNGHRMKKICVIRQGYYPNDVRVRKETLALKEKGYDVDVICLRLEDEKKIESFKGVNVYRLPVNHRREGILMYLMQYLSFFCLAFIRLMVLYPRKRYDYIQINTLPDFLVFLTVIPKVFGTKILLDLHEPSAELYGLKFGPRFKPLIKIVELVEQLSIRFADQAITVSQQMKDNYVKRGADPTKISVILNVPNLEFSNTAYSLKKEKNNGEFRLICHGAMLKRYGQDLVIKAIAIIRDKLPGIRLDILGYGEEEETLKQLSHKLHVEDFVRFHGFLPFDDMVAMVAQAHAGVVPVERNAYSDLVHTNKMFEYISMKKPVLITRTKAVEEFFNTPPAVCLQFFESGDVQDLARGIIDLYKNIEERSAMAENAYKVFYSVRWEKTSQDYCALFAG